MPHTQFWSHKKKKEENTHGNHQFMSVFADDSFICIYSQEHTRKPQLKKSSHMKEGEPLMKLLSKVI